MFDRVFREIATLKDAQLQDVIAMWTDGLLDTTKRRCLNIQVTSQTPSESRNSGSFPTQSEKDVLLVHESLDQWQRAPFPPASELKSLGLNVAPNSVQVGAQTRASHP